MLAAPGDGKILGAAILGADASDLIHETIVAMHFGATVFDFVKIPHLHPTMAEILDVPGRRARRSDSRGRAAARRRRVNGSARASSLELAIVQMKPRKGDRRANLETLADALRQLVAAPPHVVALPGSRADRLLSRGRGVRSGGRRRHDGTRTRARLASRGRPHAARRRLRLLRKRRRHVLQQRRLRCARRARRRERGARAPQDVLADVRRVRRGALSLARPPARSVPDAAGARARC